MKKYIGVCLLAVTCMVLLLLASCDNKKGKNDMNDHFFNGYVMDDTKTLESTLTKEYDLNELRSFFKNSNANESIGFGSTEAALMFSEVNDMYPVEILRSGGYSVYKVTQGGYFYVFWVKPFSAGPSRSGNEPSVYFSSYLSSDISPNRFDSLRPGISTAEDVRRMDPSFELSFLSSNGTFSYSYINDETILQIEYTYQGNIDGYDDLIVKEKRIVTRASTPARYSALLSSDLP